MKTKMFKRLMVFATVALMLFGINIPATQAAGLSSLADAVNGIERTVNSGARMVNTVQGVGKTLGITGSNSNQTTKAKPQQSLELIPQNTQSVASTINAFIWYADANGQEYTGGITEGDANKVHQVINQHMSDKGVVIFSEKDSQDFLNGYGVSELTAGDIPQWIMDAVVQKGWSQVWGYRVTGSSHATVAVNPKSKLQTLQELPQLQKVEELGIQPLDFQYGQVLVLNEKGSEMVDLSTAELVKKYAKKQMPNGINLFVAPRSYVQDAYLLWQNAGQEMTQSAHDNAGGHLYNMSQLGNLSVLTTEQVRIAEQTFGTSASNLACFKMNRQTLNVSIFDKIAVFSRKVNDVTDVVGKVVNIGKGKWKEALGIYDYDW